MKTSPPAQQMKTRTVFQVRPRLAEPVTSQAKTRDTRLPLERECFGRTAAGIVPPHFHSFLAADVNRSCFSERFGATGSIHSDKTAVNKPQTSAAQSCCTSCTQQCITAGDFSWMRRHGSINLHSLPSSPVASWQLSPSHHGVDYKGRHLH